LTSSSVEDERGIQVLKKIKNVENFRILNSKKGSSKSVAVGVLLMEGRFTQDFIIEHKILIRAKYWLNSNKSNFEEISRPFF